MAVLACNANVRQIKKRNFLKTRFRARYCQIDVTKIRCTESISAKKYIWKPLKSLFNTVIKRRIDVMQFPAISSHMCAICCYRQKFFFCNFCIYQVLETHGCKAKKTAEKKVLKFDIQNCKITMTGLRTGSQRKFWYPIWFGDIFLCKIASRWICLSVDDFFRKKLPTSANILIVTGFLSIVHIKGRLWCQNHIQEPKVTCVIV